MQYVLKSLADSDIVGFCPDCQSPVEWSEVKRVAEDETVKRDGWGTMRGGCDCCHLSYNVEVLSKPFKILKITSTC